MIYLQTSCWSLAQRSRLMTLEHGSESEENCNLRSAKAGHSSNICLSSPYASVLHKLQIRLYLVKVAFEHGYIKVCIPPVCRGLHIPVHPANTSRSNCAQYHFLPVLRVCPGLQDWMPLWCPICLPLWGARLRAGIKMLRLAVS